MRYNNALSIIIYLMAIFFLLSISLSFAQSIPPYIIYQGRLVDQTTGAPINGLKSITFSLYNTETGGIPVYYQTKNTNVTNGVFSVHIGKGEGFYDGNIIMDGIPSLVFTENSACYIGIKIEDSQAEMTPRQLIPSVAYAYKAQEAESVKGLGGVPSGMIGLFAGECPPGWTEYAPLRGRTFIGTFLSGTDEDIVGTAFSDLQIPEHTHTYSQVINHTHNVLINDPGHGHELRHGRNCTNCGSGDFETKNYPNRTPGDPSWLSSLVGHNITSITASTVNPSNAVAVGTTDSAPHIMPYIQLRACQAP